MENQTTLLTHKGSGIASFAIAVISFCLLLLGMWTATVMNDAGKFTPVLSMVMVSSAILLGLVSLIGITSGFFGARNPSSKKIFPVLGLILNLFVVLFILLLFLTPH